MCDGPGRLFCAGLARARRIQYGRPHAPVAQLDRALPSEGRGHTFESCRVRHKIKHLATPFRARTEWVRKKPVGAWARILTTIPECRANPS